MKRNTLTTIVLSALIAVSGLLSIASNDGVDKKDPCGTDTRQAKEQDARD